MMPLAGKVEGSLPSSMGRIVHGSEQMWVAIQKELREVVWLASVVLSLSVVGVALAVALALA